METRCNFEVISDTFKFTEGVFSKNKIKWQYILYKNLGVSEWVTSRLPILPSFNAFCKVCPETEERVEHRAYYPAYYKQMSGLWQMRLTFVFWSKNKNIICVSESHPCCHCYCVSVFSTRYALRPKKGLSIEHIIQHITNRCQQSDRWDFPCLGSLYWKIL
jgi:hypothetical protein